MGSTTFGKPIDTEIASLNSKLTNITGYVEKTYTNWEVAQNSGGGNGFNYNSDFISIPSGTHIVAFEWMTDYFPGVIVTFRGSNGLLFSTLASSLKISVKVRVWWMKDTL